MKPIERVKKIINFYKSSISAFEKSTGLSNNSIQTAIKRKSNLKDETLNTILKKYTEINPTWLLTGKGSMLLDNNKDGVVSGSVVSEPEAVYKTTPVREKEPPQASVLQPEIQFLREKITFLENIIKDKGEIINLYKVSLKDKEETIISQKEKLKVPAEPPANQSRLTLQQRLQEDNKRKGLRK